MSKVRVVYRQDGGVSVVHPAPKSRRGILEDGTVFSQDDIRLDDLDREGIAYALEPENQWLKRVFAKATPDGVEYDDINKFDLPQDREDRMAWEGKRGEGVRVNQVRAAELQAAKERAEKIRLEKERILEGQAIANLEELNEI